MTDTDPSTRTPPRSGRGLRIAFAVSLALNLAVAGLVAGAFLRDGPPHGGRDFGMGPLSEALSRDDRRAMRAAFLDRYPGLRADRGAMREDVQVLLGTLRADPFDPMALDDALAAIARRNGELLATGQELLAARIKAMDPDDRAAFADRLEKKLPRAGKRDKSKGTDD